MAYNRNAPWEVARFAQKAFGLPQTGKWDEETQRAYEGGSPSARAQVDQLMTREGLSAYSVKRVTAQVSEPRMVDRSSVVSGQVAGAISRASAKPRSVSRAIKPPRQGTPVREQVVKPPPPALVGSTGSGWEARVWRKMRDAGVPDASMRAVLNQVKVETGGRLQVAESHLYRPDWLKKNLRSFRDKSADWIRSLQARGPEAFFNFAYGDRKDLGNRGQGSGDGFKYRGRGPFQLTGRSNYERVGKILGVNLLDDPDWIVRNEENAVASAVAYLKMSGKLSQPLTVAQMSKLVNPGLT